MSVYVESCKKVYLGNGLTREWSYDFPLPDVSYMEVWLSEGEFSPVRLFDGYTVDRASCRVVYPTDPDIPALPVGHKLILLRNIPITQPVELPNQQGRFLAKNTEAALDRATMQIQQLYEMLDRAVVGSVDQTGGGKAYAALMAAIDETKRIRDATEAIKNIAGACAERSCSCADAAEDWYNKIGGVFLSIDPNFFANFFILAGVADGGSCSGLDMFINDGGTAATFAFIEPINDGRRGCPADWHIINPAIADTLRGRSIVSGRLLENGEVIFTTD